MTSYNSSQMPSSVEEVFHKRATFRTLLHREHSLVEAAEAHVKKFGDFEFANHEMLRTNLVIGPEGGELPSHVQVAEEGDEMLKQQAATVLTLQRLALRNVIAHQLRPVLSAIAARDEVLEEELEHNRRRFATEREYLSEAMVRELQTDNRLAEISRRDLAKVARMILEQEAMRETMARDGLGEGQSQQTFQNLCRAARERVASLVPALQGGEPLRRVLAADIALESTREEQTSQSAAQLPTDLPRQGRSR